MITGKHKIWWYEEHCMNYEACKSCLGKGVSLLQPRPQNSNVKNTLKFIWQVLLAFKIWKQWINSTCQFIFDVNDRPSNSYMICQNFAQRKKLTDLLNIAMKIFQRKENVLFWCGINRYVVLHYIWFDFFFSSA